MSLKFPAFHTPESKKQLNKIAFKQQSGQNVTEDFIEWLINTPLYAEGTKQDYFEQDMIKAAVQQLITDRLSDIPNDPRQRIIYSIKHLIQHKNSLYAVTTPIDWQIEMDYQNYLFNMIYQDCDELGIEIPDISTDISTLSSAKILDNLYVSLINLNNDTFGSERFLNNLAIASRLHWLLFMS